MAKTYQVKLLEEEYQKAKALADNAEMSVQALLQEMLLSALKRRKAPKKDG